MNSRRGLSNYVFSACNRFAWHLAFPKSFQRHPGVHDWFSDPQVGAGNGLGRSTDVIGLRRVLRRYGTAVCAGGGAVLDLGCGDGAALRIMRLAGLANVIGIESDPYLVSLCRANEPEARVLSGDFTSPQTISDVGRSVRLVFAFNPAPAPILVHALQLLLEQLGSFRLILANPVSRDEVEGSPQLAVRTVDTWRNYWIADVSEFSNNA